MGNLTVVIPSRNTQNLAACVAAVRRHEPTVKIVIVDDGLELGRLARRGACWLCAHDPIRLVSGSKPFVYARNVNLGMKRATEEFGAGDLLLLNDDALLETPGGFSKLQHQALVHPECGILAPLTNGGASAQRPQRGEKQTLRYEPVMLPFLCVLIPRAVLDRIGFLDERFGLHAEKTVGPLGYGCEDDDYSWRVRQAGWKLGIYAGCYVDHRRLASTFRDNPARPYDVVAHERLFEEKWGRSPRKPVAF